MTYPQFVRTRELIENLRLHGIYYDYENKQDNIMEPTVHPEVIADANRILSILAEKSREAESLNRTGDMVTRTDYVLIMMHTILGGNEQELKRNREKLLGFTNAMGAHPYGVVNFGTGVACDLAGITGERGQKAIRFLKAEQRLMQCGKGRGKCLVILSRISFPEVAEDNIEVPAQDNANANAELSVSDMLRKIRESWRNLEKTNNALEKEILTLRTAIEEKDQRIQELNQQLSIMNMATWQ